MLAVVPQPKSVRSSLEPTMATLAVMKESLRGTAGQIHRPGAVALAEPRDSLSLSQIRLWESLRLLGTRKQENLCVNLKNVVH